jgi:hypothetical protein
MQNNMKIPRSEMARIEEKAGKMSVEYDKPYEKCLEKALDEWRRETKKREERYHSNARR